MTGGQGSGQKGGLVSRDEDLGMLAVVNPGAIRTAAGT